MINDLDNTTPEHLDTPDDTPIQDTVDDSFFGTTRSTISTEPGRDKEVAQLYEERQQITQAANQIAAVLANSGKTVSRVLQAASQCIMRTVMIPPGGVAERLLSEHYERSVARVWIPTEGIACISTHQVSTQFDIAANNIPSNAIVVRGAVAGLNPQIYEFRTTDGLWAILDAGITTPTAVCVMEEFVS